MKEAAKLFGAFILIYANTFGFSLSCKEIWHPSILALMDKHAIDFAVCIKKNSTSGSKTTPTVLY
jgi:hypothetical protein